MKNEKLKLGRYTKIDKRIEFYTRVKNYLKKRHIQHNMCLKKLDMPDQYSVANVIYLTEKFGTTGKYGYIYKAHVKGITDADDVPLAAKLMINDVNGDNKREINLSIALSNHILKEKLSQHFLFCYKTLHCKNKTRKIHSILIYKMENNRLGCINRYKNGFFFKLKEAN
jgi:hypothetical protein